jgi:hypothetical protein
LRRGTGRARCAACLALLGRALVVLDLALGNLGAHRPQPPGIEIVEPELRFQPGDRLADIAAKGGDRRELDEVAALAGRMVAPHALVGPAERHRQALPGSSAIEPVVRQ